MPKKKVKRKQVQQIQGMSMRQVDKVIEHRVNLMRAAYLSVLEEQGWGKKRLAKLDEDVAERVGRLMDSIREKAMAEGADVQAIIAPVVQLSWWQRAYMYIRGKLKKEEDDGTTEETTSPGPREEGAEGVG